MTKSLGDRVRDMIHQSGSDTELMWVPATPAEAARRKALDDRDQILQEIRGMTFEQSKSYLMREIILRKYPHYEFTPYHTNILRMITKWIWRIEDPMMDLAKGFLLIGAPGTGKTAIMEMISIWSQIIERRRFKMCYAKLACDEARKQKDTQVDNQYYRGSWCIDEIGHEQGENNVWGNKVAYISDLLEHRYQRGLITHGTSNKDLDPDSGSDYLGLIYPARVISRMHAMFNVIPLNVDDWRKK